MKPGATHRRVGRSSDGGFTLVELLIVVVIIGVLAAIALPTMVNQREKAWRRATMGDLRNAASVMEQYYDDRGTFLPVAGYVPGVTAPYNFSASGSVTHGVEVSLPVAAATTAIRFCIEADHIKLNGGGTTDFHFDSQDGRPMPGAC